MKKIVVVALVAWFGFSLAQDTTPQDTTSCAALLEPQNAAIEQAEDLFSNIHSLNMNIATVQTIEGEELAIVLQILYDFDAARIYQTTRIRGEEILTLRFANGKATITRSGMNGEMPAPTELETQLQEQLDESLSSAMLDPTSMWRDTEIISCDGMKQYGDVIAGEQVTVQLKAGEGNVLLQNVMPDAPLQLIFVDGQSKASIQDLPELGPTLMIFDLTQNAKGVVERMAMQQYSWDGTEAKATGSMTMDFSYNVPIDETLFNP